MFVGSVEFARDCPVSWGIGDVYVIVSEAFELGTVAVHVCTE